MLCLQIVYLVCLTLATWSYENVNAIVQISPALDGANDSEGVDDLLYSWRTYGVHNTQNELLAIYSQNN